ncbi:polymorphic toxin-type HINT domain-containing protein [Actinocatenispora sera]|uniref:polymorphic toxin-type HINT domain-containing protein n=1 Tax=Actinocatenispora sera TaxID=390989 RepID=UPI0033FFC490
MIVTHTDHDFVDLTITTKASRSRRLPAGVAGPVATATSHATAALTTTTHHPFWDVTTHTWTQAASLHPGDSLQTPTGRAQVVALHLYTATQATYDLTIHRLHTYYVKAGSTSLLVHNCGRVYRSDTREPSDIFQNGFEPRGTNMDLMEHASGYSTDSGYVTTTKYENIASSCSGNVYHIDGVDGVDVNY